jgi:hypothetical protein
MTAIVQLPPDQVAALRFEDVRLYLASRHWQLDPDASAPGAGVYRFASEAAAEVLLPLRRDWSDYSRRMAEAIQTIAAVEQRPASEVLHDLAMPPGDVLRLRIRSPEAALGMLPLEEGLHLLQGGRDLVLAAACSAHQPRAYYPRQSNTRAVEFLSRCLVGQTEQGSYVATIIAPIPPMLTPSPGEVEGPDDPAGEPYERRVTLYLMQGLQTIQSAIESGRAEDILHGIRRGVSANLCEALAVMTPVHPRASLEVSMSWSRTRPRVPEHVPASVTFAQGEFAVIREAGRRLRQSAAARRERVEGTVIGLRAEPAHLFDQFEGRVTLRALIDGRPTRVRFVLDQADYARACDAHRDRRRVAVTGVLRRDARANGFELSQPQAFQVLADATATG